MIMNILLLSSLALVSASDFVELPFYMYATSETVPAKDGSSGVTFKRENRVANISIYSDRYTTHLEPEFGDIWIFKNLGPDEPVEGGWEQNGMFDLGELFFGQADFMVAYAKFDEKLVKNYSKIGGLGLGPKNSSTYNLPDVRDLNRAKIPNFADQLKLQGYSRSLAFTINPPNDCSPEGKLVYGAMDLSQFTGKLKILHRDSTLNLINAEFTINGVKANAALEPEDPNSYLDDEVVAEIARKFGAYWDDNRGFSTLTAFAPQEDLVVDFDGFEIRVPAADVWVQDKEDKEKWYFTVRPLSSSTIEPRRATIGANILKHVYIVYDLERDRAAIGKAVRNPGPPVYEVFPAEGIPEKFLMTQGSCS